MLGSAGQLFQVGVAPYILAWARQQIRIALPERNGRSWLSSSCFSPSGGLVFVHKVKHSVHSWCAIYPVISIRLKKSICLRRHSELEYLSVWKNWGTMCCIYALLIDGCYGNYLISIRGFYTHCLWSFSSQINDSEIFIFMISPKSTRAGQISIL